MTQPHSFASDNYSGAHPSVMTAVNEANSGHQPSYGADDSTTHLREIIRREFGDTVQVFPMLTGTGANVVALQAMARPWEAVVCTDTAHIHLDEGGAPEKVAGLKLWQVPAPAGKLTPELVDQQAWGFGDVHRAQPAVLTITQSTEQGTVYSPAELVQLVDHAHDLGMRVHLDGARLANAAAHLNVPLRAITTDVGIDALSLGGTKNGAMSAEAIVVLNEAAVPGVDFLRKTAMQLTSKMRYTSAQLAALLTDELWLANARTSNAMAQRLYEGVKDLPDITISRQPQVNSVFATLPLAVRDRLREKYSFYIWDNATGEVRWMCSWDTTEADVDDFVAAIKAELTR